MKSGIKNVFQSIDPTVSNTNDLEGAGTVYVDQLGAAFRWVKNSGAGASAIGDVAFHGTASAAGSFHKEVFTAGQSAKGTAANTMAGVWTGVVASASYGWIQIRGYNASILTESTTDIAATDVLKWVSGQKYVIKDVASGTAPTSGRNHIIALAAATADSANLVAGDIRCW